MKQKAPFSDLIKERRSFMGITLARMVVVVVAITFLSAGVITVKHFTMVANQKKYGVESGKIKKMVIKIQDLEREISEKQSEVSKLLFNYEEKTGKPFSYLNLFDLSDEEKGVLERNIRNEKRITLKSLLGAILEKVDRVSELRKRMIVLEKQLPKPIMVKEGQNHYQIALEYLINERGIKQEDARELVERSILFDHLLPGFKVWNYYAEGKFGSFITQGEAAIAPGRVQKNAKQKLVSFRNQMVLERNKFSADNTKLKADNRNLNTQLSDLSREHNSLNDKHIILDNRFQDLDKQWNSLFYRLDLQEHLLEAGIIKGRFLRKPVLNEFSPEDFSQSIDLRELTVIQIHAAGLNAKKIRDLKVYPKIFKRNIDYKVSVGDEGAMAVLTILNPEKLKNERMVISVN